MKQLSQKISEALKDSDKPILDYIGMLAKFSSGVHQELAKQKQKDLDSVECVPLSEVFSKQEISDIKKYVHPIMKECYRNAWRLCDHYAFTKDHDIKYVEGFINFHGFPIEHAFNKVDGKYVDITQEIALKNDVTKEAYCVYGEFDTDTVRDILLQNGFYGQIYDTVFLNKYHEKIDKDTDAA